MAKQKLSLKMRNFIAFCEQYYFLHDAGFPTPQEAAEALNYTVTEIHYFMEHRTVREALDRRGLPWRNTARPLSPEQVAAAFAAVNYTDERPIDVKLQKLGIHPDQYHSWLSNPSFRAFMNRIADTNMANVRPEALAGLQTLVRKRDLNAIKYYFEVTGEFQAPEIQSLQVIVQRIIEAIQRHVQDPEVLLAISRDVAAAVPHLDQSGRSNAFTSSQRVIEGG